MIKYDYTNLLYSDELTCGIKRESIDNLKEKATEAHKSILEDRKKNVVGFFDLPDKNIEKIVAFTNRKKNDFDNIVVLGIGGSALGNRALYSALKLEKNLSKNLSVVDNVDPYLLYEVLSKIDLKRTLFNVITKSGTTAETMSCYLIILDILKKELKDNYKKNIVITTDKQKGFLRPIVEKDNLDSFVVPDNVGGRFSVFTDVGLVSSAFVGIDIGALLEGAKKHENFL